MHLSVLLQIIISIIKTVNSITRYPSTNARPLLILIFSTKFRRFLLENHAYQQKIRIWSFFISWTVFNFLHIIKFL